MQHLRVGDYRRMPWKNGGGTTSEIAIHPPGSGLSGAPFIWRVSIAEVTASGPFSAFPGIDRSIAVIEGEGMVLSFAGAPSVHMERPYEPHAFSGDLSCDCTLIGGPIRDFNVMTARGACRHEVEFHDLGALSIILELAGAQNLLHLVAGAVLLRLPASGRAMEIGTGETLILEGAVSGVELKALSSPVVLARAAFFPQPAIN